MTNRVRIGLVGAGFIAHRSILPALVADPRVDLAGVVTRTPESAERALSRWPFESAYPTLEDMIEKARLDGVCVLTPHDDHFGQVTVALQSGVDVFCEKPLANTYAEASELAQMADDLNRVLMVGFNRRYADLYKRALEEFSDREINFLIAQKNRNGTQYRSTHSNALHLIDVMRWFCGEAAEVSGHAIAPSPYEETGTAALIRFESGAVGMLLAARSAGEWEEQLDVFGGMTTVRVRIPDTLEIVRDGETRRVETRPKALGFTDSVESLGFTAEMAHFVDCVESRDEPITSGWEAARTQRLVETILETCGLPV